MFTAVEDSTWPDLSPVLTPRTRCGGKVMSALSELQGIKAGGIKGDKPKENENAISKSRETSPLTYPLEATNPRTCHLSQARNAKRKRSYWIEKVVICGAPASGLSCLPPDHDSHINAIS